MRHCKRIYTVTYTFISSTLYNIHNSVFSFAMIYMSLCICISNDPSSMYIICSHVHSVMDISPLIYIRQPNAHGRLPKIKRTRENSRFKSHAVEHSKYQTTQLSCNGDRGQYFFLPICYIRTIYTHI